MARLNLTLDPDTYLRLLDSALSDRRPVDWQAEHIIRRALKRRVDRPKSGRLSVVTSHVGGDGPRAA